MRLGKILHLADARLDVQLANLEGQHVHHQHQALSVLADQRKKVLLPPEDLWRLLQDQPSPQRKQALTFIHHALFVSAAQFRQQRHQELLI
jgi:hypothetical protein